MSDLPQWTMDYIANWKQRLLLCEWTISTALSPHPNNDASGDTAACVTMNLHTRQAHIDFLNTIPDDLATVAPDRADQWQINVIHELLHIRLCNLEAVAKDDMAAHLPPGVVMMAESVWTRESETVIEILAGVLYRLSVGDE